MKRKLKGEKATSPSFSHYCTNVNFTDKNKISITLAFLNKFYDESLKAKKKPFVIFGIKRNEKEIFIIEGELKLERK
jgi:hypothetical protein